MELKRVDTEKVKSDIKLLIVLNGIETVGTFPVTAHGHLPFNRTKWN